MNDPRGVKAVVFDLFETLISEFDSGRPSHTEVAQTLQLPVKEFQEDIVMRRATGYPVLYHPSEVVDRVNERVAPHT